MPSGNDRRRIALCGPRDRPGKTGAPLAGIESRQSAFAAALLDPDRPVPPGLVGPDGKSSVKRFNIYRNNVVAGLAATLKDAFPAVARIVGDEFFAAMARIYAAAEPPGSPVMLDYGAGFADFIGGFEPASALPYLSDVARIERAWAESYHAPEAAPLDACVFDHLDPQHLPDVCLALHPSFRLVRSSFPALTIWQMNIECGTPGHVDLTSGGEDILVLRPHAEVEVRALPPGGAEFIQAICLGLSVSEALRIATSADGRFNLSVNLAGLMQANAFVGLGLTAASQRILS